MANKVHVLLSILLLFYCLCFYLFCAYLLNNRYPLYQRKLAIQEMTTYSYVPWRGPERGEAAIMFVETSCALQEKQHRLSPHQACAIESATRADPTSKIYVFHTCITDKNKDVPAHPDAYMRHFYMFANVFFLHLNVTQLVEGSILKDWWATNSGDSSQWKEVVSLLLLWKYGGIYMDLDFVVIRSISQFSNFIGSEGESLLANAFGFNADGPGHQQVEEFLREINSTYSGNKTRTDNGENLLTRVMLRSCNVSHVSAMTEELCNGVHILPRDVFYPNPENIIRRPGEKDDDNHTIAESLIDDGRTKAVYIGKEVSVSVGSDHVHGILASKFCPRVYTECGDTFY